VSACDGALMKWFVALSALVALQVSVGAHAQSGEATVTWKPGVAVAVAPHAPASGKGAVETTAASHAPMGQPTMSGGVGNGSDIPPACASCPLLATCFPT